MKGKGEGEDLRHDKMMNEVEIFTSPNSTPDAEPCAEKAKKYIRAKGKRKQLSFFHFLITQPFSCFPDFFLLLSPSLCFYSFPHFYNV